MEEEGGPRRQPPAGVGGGEVFCDDGPQYLPPPSSGDAIDEQPAALAWQVSQSAILSVLFNVVQF